MGIGEELMLDAFIDHIFWLEEVWSDIDEGVWTTKDGTQIHVSKMSASHIQNCIKMIERTIEESGDNWSDNEEQVGYAYIDLFRSELVRRYPPVDPAFVNG